MKNKLMISVYLLLYISSNYSAATETHIYENVLDESNALAHEHRVLYESMIHLPMFGTDGKISIDNENERKRIRAKLRVIDERLMLIRPECETILAEKEKEAAQKEAASEKIEKGAASEKNNEKPLMVPLAYYMFEGEFFNNNPNGVRRYRDLVLVFKNKLRGGLSGLCSHIASYEGVGQKIVERPALLMDEKKDEKQSSSSGLGRKRKPDAVKAKEESDEDKIKKLKIDILSMKIQIEKESSKEEVDISNLIALQTAQSEAEVELGLLEKEMLTKKNKITLNPRILLLIAKKAEIQNNIDQISKGFERSHGSTHKELADKERVKRTVEEFISNATAQMDEIDRKIEALKENTTK